MRFMVFNSSKVCKAIIIKDKSADQLSGVYLFINKQGERYLVANDAFEMVEKDLGYTCIGLTDIYFRDIKETGLMQIDIDKMVELEKKRLKVAEVKE